MRMESWVNSILDEIRQLESDAERVESPITAIVIQRAINSRVKILGEVRNIYGIE